MATLKEKVEGLISSFSGEDGSSVSDAQLKEFIAMGGRYVVDLLPSSSYEGYRVSTGLSSNAGIDISNYVQKSIIASRLGVKCREVDGANSSRYSTTGSIFEATAGTPVFYIKGKILYILPTPTQSDTGDVLGVKYPAIDEIFSNGAFLDNITNFPRFLEDGAVIYAAMLCMQKLVSDAQKNEDIELAGLRAQNLTSLKSHLGDFIGKFIQVQNPKG